MDVPVNGIARNTVTNTFYVANNLLSNVTVSDGKTNTTTTVSSMPPQVANKVYVSNYRIRNIRG
jgi:hypothetical protein